MKMRLCDLISLLLVIASLFCGICAAVIYGKAAQDSSELSLWGFPVEAYMGFAMLSALGIIICCCCKRSMA